MSSRSMLGEEPSDQVAITDVALDERVAAVALHSGEIVQVIRMGELVEVDSHLIGLRELGVDKVAPMEPAQPVTRIM